jgi:hypothetical protein
MAKDLTLEVKILQNASRSIIDSLEDCVNHDVYDFKTSTTEISECADMLKHIAELVDMICTHGRQLGEMEEER